jgi:hypothetical protein
MQVVPTADRCPAGAAELDGLLQLAAMTAVRRCPVARVPDTSRHAWCWPQTRCSVVERDDVGMKRCGVCVSHGSSLHTVLPPYYERLVGFELQG